MKVVLSHPTGNENVRAAASGLLEAGLLAEFYTCLAFFESRGLDKLGSISLFSEIKRRRFNPALLPITKTLPWFELGRLVASKAGFSKLVKHEIGIFSIDSIFAKLDKHVASQLKNLKSRGIDSVYAYEDGAKFSFLEAKNLGINCFYDLPTGYWRSLSRLLEGEKERWPEWTKTMTSFNDSSSKLEKKDEELKLADRIIVASSFTSSTLKDYPGKLPPIKVIPYGFPPVVQFREYKLLKQGQKLKLLFVGKLTQQKGIADLFEAVKPFSDKIELTIVGNTTVNDCDILNASLKMHNWIRTINHQGVLGLMRQSNVLIFPSLFDGYGLVIAEAMSQGTPVICSDRSAGPDLIRNNENGWLMKAGSIDDLKNILENLLTSPSMLEEVGQEAMKTASKRPWAIYKSELCKTIINFKKDVIV